MILQEFLATASADHTLALVEAQAYAYTEPALYTANVMAMRLVGAGLYGVLSDTANTPGHPVRDICLALMDRLRSEGEFNLAPSHPLGVANIAMLDALIAGLPDHATALTALKTQLLADAERTVQPFAGATLYDVLAARDAVPTLAVTLDGQGFALVEAAATCPRHSPVLRGYNPRTQKWQVVGRFANVSGVGRYECRVDHPHRAWALEVENAYAVLSAV